MLQKNKGAQVWHSCIVPFRVIEYLKEYAPNMSRICAEYVSNLGRICAEYAPNLGRICAEYAPNMRRIWAEYAQEDCVFSR